jgi:flavoprotein
MKKEISHEYVGHTLESFEFESCKGCQQYPPVCNMITMNNQDICPCIKCLVKSSCKVHCPEYNRIFNTSIGCTTIDPVTYITKKISESDIKE